MYNPWVVDSKIMECEECLWSIGLSKQRYVVLIAGHWSSCQVFFFLAFWLKEMKLKSLEMCTKARQGPFPAILVNK